MRGQALTIPRALMLFSALLMAILIVRMVGYHYSVSDKQQKTFRFMLAATDIIKKLSASSECLSMPQFADRGILDFNKLEDFKANYSNIEPECAYDYHLAWRAHVVERPFSYFSPVLVTKTEFGQDNDFEASNLLLLSKNQSNVTIVNYTTHESNSSSVIVNTSYIYPYNQRINFTSSLPVWAINQNYEIRPPRHATPLAIFGSAQNLCLEGIQEFPTTQFSFDDIDEETLNRFPVIFFSNITDIVLTASQKDDINKTICNHTVIAITPSISFIDFTANGTIYWAGDNCTGSIFVDNTVPSNLTDIIDLARGRGPSDLLSFYGLQFLTYVPQTLWILPSYDMDIRIDDLSTQDDLVELSLENGESIAVTGFDSDVVEVKSTRPVWVLTGDRGGLTWLQSRSITFPSFGNFSLIAEEDSNVSLQVLDDGAYTSGPDYTRKTYALDEGHGIYYNNTNIDGYRWVSVNSTGLLTILTWSDHGAIHRESPKVGENWQIRTTGLGEIQACGSNINVVPILPLSLVHSNCYSLQPQPNQTVTLTSEEGPIQLHQSLGGAQAEQPMISNTGDDLEAVAIADAVNATMAPPYANLGQHNLFYLYRSSPDLNLPSFYKGIILLYNDPQVFAHFGISSSKADIRGCRKWSTSTRFPVFSSPYNITETELAAFPYQGCTYSHTFSEIAAFAINNEKDLDTIAGFTYTPDLTAVASIRPLRSNQMKFVVNLGRFIEDHLFITSNQTEWDFGSLNFSYGSTKNQQISITMPVGIYHNTSDIRPGQLEVTVVEGELESIAGMIDSVCKDNEPIVKEMAIAYPLSAQNSTLCQTGLACRPIHCKRNIFISLEPGFRIVKASGNKTGVFVS